MDAILLSACVPQSSPSLLRPLGAYQLAWYLRKFSYDIQVIEFIHRFSEEELIALIAHFVTPKTKFIGLSAMINMEAQSMGSTIKKFENVLQKVKKRWPDIKIVVGGPAAPYWSRLWRNKTLFDYIFTGHGEDTMLGLANHLCRGEPAPQFEILDGNRFIRETFSMPHGEKFDITKDNHLWSDQDCIQPGEALPLELGRGCIFSCKFCRYPYIGKSKNDFSRDMDCVKQELLDNYNRWGVTNYYMLDDTFNASQDRMEEFYKMTQTLPFKLKYATYLRTDLLAAYPDTQYYLLDSGLVGAYLGVETFNPQAASMIGKNWSPKAREYLPRLNDDIWQNRVNFQVGLICGLPPETWDDCYATNKWMIDNYMPGWAWHALSVTRDAYTEFKSEFDTNAEEYGFTWTLDDGKPMWQTEYCNRKTAREWEVKLMEISKPYQKITAWYLVEFGNYTNDTPGHSLNFETIRNTTFTALPWRMINGKRDEFFSNYVAQLKRITP
jgi:radical SAM superfamily enzyme YgiQ (UPF0313 family)